jgi:hypothetical protein
MKKLTAILSVFILTTIFGFSYKENSPAKSDKIYYKETQIETDDYTLMIVAGVSTDNETKFKLKIVNKTASFLTYNGAESKFIINGASYEVKEKPLMVEPYQTASKVINLKGEGYNKVKSYTFLLSGIYKINPNTTPILGEDYKLPAAKNTADIGPFTLTLNKLTKETDKTLIKFDCVYNGEKSGFIYPIKMAVKMPDGKDYATVKKEKPILLLKGQTEDFTLLWERMPGGKANDMQLVDMFVKWNDAFSEADKVKAKDETFTLNIDEEKSAK